MLRNVTLKSSIVPRCSTLLVQHFRNSSVATAQFSTWAQSSTKSPYYYKENNRKNHGSAARVSRRPTVNGQPVAFHVSELKQSLMVQREVPAAREYESDMIVVLDMDECLIHSQFFSPNAQLYAHQVQQRQQQEQNHSASSSVDTFSFHLPDGDLVKVHLRPGVHDFLEQVTSRFETHIFTAAAQIYANPVLDHFDRNGEAFAGRWFRDSCHYQAGAYVKRLENLPLNADFDRVVLVDNNPLSFLSNPANGILVNSFFKDPTDTTLAAVWDLLVELDESNADVRPVLREKFALEEALQRLQQKQSIAA